MRELFLAVILLLPMIAASAQTQIAEISLTSNKVDDLQAFPVGDSLFLMYEEGRGEAPVRRAWWITSSGRVAGSPFRLKDGAALVEIVAGQQAVNYYSIRHAGKLELFVSQQIGDAFNEIKVTDVTGLLLGAFRHGSRLIVLSYERDINEFSVQLINGSRVEKKHNVVLPVNVKSIIKDAARVDVHDPVAVLYSGASKMKFYFTATHLVINVDFPYETKDSRTDIIQIDLDDGSVTSRRFPAVNNMDFRSIFFRDRLYRFSFGLKHGVLFSVLDTNNRILFEELTQKKDAVRDSVIYHRPPLQTGFITFREMYALIPESDPLISLVEEPDSTVTIVTGIYTDMRGNGSIVGTNPLAMLATFAVTHAISRMTGPAGVCSYFYVRQRTDNGFITGLKSDPDGVPLLKAIDDYEFSRTRAFRNKGSERWNLYLQYRGYVALNNRTVLGIYQEKRDKEKRLLIYSYRR